MFVVTGGGSGIGRAVAHQLAIRKKSVLIVGRRQSKLEETASYSPLIRYIHADVSTTDGRQTIVNQLSAESKIEGLIHNAGIIDPISSIQLITEQDWNKALATNVGAPLFLTQLLHEKLIGARVLNIGSGAAHFPVAGWAPYCVSKAALYMLTQCWKEECPEIAFASVCPGIIDTDMQTKIRHSNPVDPEKQAFFIQLKKNNQLVSSETVSLFLSWLLLDVPKDRFIAKEWDIYDQAHHHEWLISPHTVPTWERDE